MRYFVCAVLVFIWFAPVIRAGEILEDTRREVSSPDDNYRFVTYQKQNSQGERQLYYTLCYGDRKVILESELGVLIENQLFESALGISNDPYRTWGANLTLQETFRRSEDSRWKPVYGERSEVRDLYNELILTFQKGAVEGTWEDGYDKRQVYSMDLVVRAYNEGVAFRYYFPESSNGLFLHITGEQTQFAFPEQTMAYYEQWAQGPYELLPLSGWKDECERPLTLKLENGLTVALTEAEMVSYSRMKFRLSEEKENALQASLYGSVDVILPYGTPWRVIMAAEKATGLIENNDIILNLNAPCEIEDIAWIKPGKVIRSGLSQSQGVACVDFAAQRGLQYVHLDAGWYGAEMKYVSDATSVFPDKELDMPALCRYAAERGIGIWVYVNQRALVQQLDEILPLYREWGIKGLKFGFVQIGNQHWTTWLHDAVRKCAEYGMMVDIHDEYRPTGFSRTYPNLMTQEGIRGNEEMPDATHNVILPYTHFLAGAGDYTLCYYSPRIQTTHAHQLAMAAVYYSPIQFMYWYDDPSLYANEPELEFWDRIPTVWDETRALDGEIGKYIVMARRTGREWFAGVMTGNEGRKVTVDTKFLEPGRKYRLKLYEDSDKVKTKTKVAVTAKTIQVGDRIHLDLKPSGGAALWFVPAY